jgi:phosphohistidine phosphatase
MHRLHLLRHAKSGYPGGVEDRERPLSKRGREAARRVGGALPALLGRVDLVLCSSALRTRETADLALAGFAPRPRILFEDGLYLANWTALLRRLRGLDEACGSVLLVGHNPGLHELAIALAATGAPLYAAMASGKFPTTARASFEIASEWAALERSRNALVDYVTLKSLGAAD